MLLLLFSCCRLGPPVLAAVSICYTEFFRGVTRIGGTFVLFPQRVNLVSNKFSLFRKEKKLQILYSLFADAKLRLYVCAC